MEITLLAQPANDLFEHRTVLSGSNVVTAISFSGATLEAVPGTYPFAVSDVWYSWTAPTNGFVKVEGQDRLGHSFEVRVYSGTEPSQLSLLTAVSLESYFAITAGVTYAIRAVRYSNTELGELRLQFIPPITNDLFKDRIELTGDAVSVELSALDATYNPGEPMFYTDTKLPVTWWKWTAPADGMVLIDGRYAMVFEGSDLTNLTRLPEYFEARAGNEYQIALAGTSPIGGFRLFLQRSLSYNGLSSEGTYPYYPAPTLTWQDFADAGSITNFAASVDASTIIQTNRLVSVPLPILGEGLHSLSVSAQSSLGFYYTIKPIEFYVTHPGGSFTNRIPLSGDIVTYEADFRGIRDGLWWSWTAPFAGQATFEDLDGREAAMYLFSGSNPDQLNWIENGRVQKGVTYIIRALQQGPAVIRQIRLQLFPLPLLNDNFANSSEISGREFSDWVCLSCATTEVGEPMSLRGAYRETLWYHFVAPADGLITFSRGAGVFNWDVTVFSGSSLSSLSELTRPNYYFPQYPVQAGETYRIRFQGSDGLPNASEVRFNFESPPANDRFADAAILNGDRVRFSAEMNAATSETGEPGYSPNRRSVWWRWTPQSSGFASLAVPGLRDGAEPNYSPSGWMYRELFRGGALAELLAVPTVPLENEVIGFSVEAGETYSIRLSYLTCGFVTAPFDLELNVGKLDFISPATNAVFVLPESPRFGWAGPILTNPAARVELIEQTDFFDLASGPWEFTANRGAAVWPEFTVGSLDFSIGRKRVFGRCRSADGVTIYSPPIDFFVAGTLPLRIEVFQSMDQPQYLSVRELSNQKVGLETSSDMKTWFRGPTIQPDSTILIDPASGDARRFYRATLR